MWVIPKLTPEFIEQMNDVLTVYERPYNQRKPVVCYDEKSVELRYPSRPTKPVKLGKPVRMDSEYVRNGTANVFMAVEPKARKRMAPVRKRRTYRDFAKVIRQLLEGPYRQARKLVLVMDNLNTHQEKALIETFGKRIGRRLWNRIEPHYTPKHASWLNMAEIELSVLDTQCLDRLIGDRRMLRKEVTAWKRRRNRMGAGIDWQFTKTKAAEKFQLKYNNGKLSK